MNQPPLTAELLAGVYAKLERADENIRNLDSEIIAFLKERPAGGLSKDKHQAAREYAKFIAERPVPKRFGVLAGEVAHHLRASLDHVAWLLSSESRRREKPRAISFPIFTDRPITQQKLSDYEGKIEGISSAKALALIESVQPYNAPSPLDEPLAIIDELDRIDKHRTIVLVIISWDMTVTLPLRFALGINLSDYMREEGRASRAAENLKLEFAPQIAFAKFGERERQTVTPGLTHLANAVRDVVGLFSR